MDKLTTLELLLALYLIDYHRYAFSVRSQGILPSVKFDTHEVRELVNLVMWQGDGMLDENKIHHRQGLHSIIERNADELAAKISRVRDGNISTYILEDIDQLNLEITSAYEMMGYISDADW